MTAFTDLRLRANPRYRLDARGAADDADAHGHAPDDSTYGHLRPSRGSQLPSRPVPADVALLYLTLRRPGVVPDYFRTAYVGRLETVLRGLVLDGVLEVEQEGTFVSGAAALGPLVDAGPHRTGRLAALSVEAVHYGAALRHLSVPELTGRLYGFGHQPATTAQKRWYREAGSADGGWLTDAARSTFERYWRLTALTEHWLMWRPRANRSDDRPARFKLYVSPDVADVPQVLAVVAEVLGQDVGVNGLKIGRGLDGLNRPDKVVAYFSRLDDLHAAGADLQHRLAGAAVHGVPFTAEVSPDGMLSWGADRLVRSGTRRTESWRFWISSRLATHLHGARDTGAPGTLTAFALERLRLDGVGTAPWAPTGEFWASMKAPV